MEETIAVGVSLLIIMAVSVVVATKFFGKPEFGALATLAIIGGAYAVSPDQIPEISQRFLKVVMIPAYLAGIVFIAYLFYVFITGKRICGCLNQRH